MCIGKSNYFYMANIFKMKTNPPMTSQTSRNAINKFDLGFWIGLWFAISLFYIECDLLHL